MNKEFYRVYLDVCCLNRLYDDQAQLRIRLETEAILEIITNCQLGKWELIISTVLESEINKTPSLIRKEQLRASLFIAKNKIILTQTILIRAMELTHLGFKKYDALHLASAEHNADVFLTTDDRLLRKSITYKNQLKIVIANPITWLLDIHQTSGEFNYDPS